MNCYIEFLTAWGFTDALYCLVKQHIEKNLSALKVVLKQIAKVIHLSTNYFLLKNT
jgi:hypothetical protein